MAARLWSGTLSFSLVATPVKMLAAVQQDRLSFHMLHEEDNGRLRRRMYCPEHDRLIHPEHIVRGYPADGDQYVVVRGKEIESLEPERSQTIQIDQFAPLDTIDPLHFDRPYYLVPTGGEKPYALLVELLEKERKAGIGKFIMHEREHLVAVCSLDGVLCLFLLRFDEELRSPKEVLPEKKSARGEKRDEMEKAIKKLDGSFEPEKYEEEYRRRILELLREREEEGTVPVPEAEEPEAEEERAEEPVDLVAALEESLARTRKSS